MVRSHALLVVSPQGFLAGERQDEGARGEGRREETEGEEKREEDEYSE